MQQLLTVPQDGAERIWSCDQFPLLRILEQHWETIAAEAQAVSAKMFQWTNHDIYQGDWRVGPFYRHTRTIDGPWRRGCPKTAELLDQLAADPAVGLVSALFSLLRANTATHPHNNDDVYAYRAHMGLRVPDGDVGIDIGGKVHRWQHGKIFVWDPTVRHVAWNRTEHDRIILMVDVFRPEQPRDNMVELMNQVTRHTREARPGSLGFSGHR